MKITTEEVPVVKNYVLTLSEEEATILKVVVGMISGHGPIRDFTSRLYYRLEDAGIAWGTDEYNKYINMVSESMKVSES